MMITHALWRFFGTPQSLSLVTYSAFLVAAGTYFFQRKEREESRREVRRIQKFDAYTQLLARCQLERDAFLSRQRRTRFLFENEKKWTSTPALTEREKEDQYVTTIKFRLRASSELQSLVDEWERLISSANDECGLLEFMLSADDRSTWAEQGDIKKSYDELATVPKALHEQFLKISTQINLEISESATAN